MRSIRKVAAAVALSAIVVSGSYATAGAVTSFHGSDYSQDYSAKTRLRACDLESDSNQVKGGWSTSLTAGETGSVTDSDGANGVCATGGPGAGTIKRHHTCEKNLFSWDCDNWQTT